MSHIPLINEMNALNKPEATQNENHKRQNASERRDIHTTKQDS